MSNRARAMLVKCIVATLFIFAVASVAVAADGPALYKTHCAICHGASPAPKFVGTSADEVKKTIAEGRGKMRPVKLDAADAEAIAQFVAAK